MNMGEMAFMGGVVIAALVGLVGGMFPSLMGVAALALLVLGIIVGFLNVSDKEAVPFLVAAIALSLAGKAGFLMMDTVVPGVPIGTWVTSILGNIAIFVAPAAVIVALKSIKDLASN